MKKGFNMRKTTFIISILGLTISTQLVSAQGTLYVSNLDQTPTGSMAVGSDSWLAQPFVTGRNVGGYDLDSIQLLMDAASGTPSDFSVSIYDANLNMFAPQNSLGSLSGSINPSTGGIFTYTASDIMLLPSYLYFVVVTATTPIATGDYNWSAAGSAGDLRQWGIKPDYYSSTDGLSWGYSTPNAFQMAVYATTVPEPATGALFGISLACFGFLRLRQTK
jgi:hypothetical protein